MVVAVVLEKIIITDYLHAEANEWNELSWLTQHVIYHCLTFLKDFIVNCSLFPHGFTEKKYSAKLCVLALLRRLQ